MPDLAVFLAVAELQRKGVMLYVHPRKGTPAMTVYQALTLAIAFATLILTLDRHHKK